VLLANNMKRLEELEVELKDSMETTDNCIGDVEDMSQLSTDLVKRLMEMEIQFGRLDWAPADARHLRHCWALLKKRGVMSVDGHQIDLENDVLHAHTTKINNPRPDWKTVKEPTTPLSVTRPVSKPARMPRDSESVLRVGRAAQQHAPHHASSKQKSRNRIGSLACLAVSNSWKPEQLQQEEKQKGKYVSPSRQPCIRTALSDTHPRNVSQRFASLDTTKPGPSRDTSTRRSLGDLSCPQKDELESRSNSCSLSSLRLGRDAATGLVTEHDAPPSPFRSRYLQRPAEDAASQDMKLLESSFSEAVTKLPDKFIQLSHLKTDKSNSLPDIQNSLRPSTPKLVASSALRNSNSRDV